MCMALTKQRPSCTPLAHGGFPDLGSDAEKRAPAGRFEPELLAMGFHARFVREPIMPCVKPALADGGAVRCRRSI